MTGQHAFLAPSAVGIWGPGGCPAYPRMVQLYPDTEESEAAREGTAAHWWVEQAIRGREHPEGAATPGGVLVTDEMVDGGADMVADARACVVAGDRWALEATLRMPQVHPDLNWGRADFISVNEARRVIRVKDYKYGHGYVDAFENWQLLDYAQGAINFFEVTPGPGWTFEMMIYQPRSFHADGPVKRWEIEWAQFQGYIGKLRDAALEATNPQAPARTGAHCRYCSARLACPALRQVAGTAVDLSRYGQPAALTPAAAGRALREITAARERLEALETGLSAQIMAAIQVDGAQDTGWELKPGQGRERWSVPVEDVLALGSALGVDLAKPPAAITPAQARKKGLDAAVTSSYAERPAGEMKLVPVDSRATRKAFDN